MLKSEKIKAAILVLDDKTYVSKNKNICDSIAACFTLSDKAWRILNGRCPWKMIDKILDENEIIKN